MLTVTGDDVFRMKDALFFEGEQSHRKFTKFWTLLPLAAVIATAGITSNSTATVIGAMIVAPLMTPILGTALAIVLADRANVLRSVLMVLTGALLVVVMGYLLGLLSPVPEVAATNEQVAQRVDPHLVDLIAALATGAVGAFALVRSDISEATPIAQRWAEQQAWQVTDVQFRAGDLWVTATGPAPNIDPASLRRDLTAAGLGNVALEVQLLDGGIQQVPAS
jgi:uncharacterized hydrophobic protein (TIGR00271 family)